MAGPPQGITAELEPYNGSKPTVLGKYPPSALLPRHRFSVSHELATVLIKSYLSEDLERASPISTTPRDFHG